ncbi:mucin-2 [Procambarus clarkii]|uniref:mucin-2 n=1 Tax=Procambarus clarkii TaxID=6728 RepID=UPI0037435852
MVRPCSFMLVVGLLVMDSSAQYDSSNEKLAVSNADKIASGVIELRKRQYHRDTLLINGMYSVSDNGSSTCSQIITEPGFITSPGYPGPYPPGTSCSYEIYAPECYCPQITFLSFQLSGHDPLCSGSHCCNSDYLEIITSNTMSGNVYCGTDITAGQVFTATISTLNLFFSAEKSAPGWSATVSLVPIPGCVVRNLARVADSLSPSDFTAPTITDFTAPTITDFTAPTITDFTAPTITDFTAPTITDFTAPTITDFTAPTITDFTAPTIADFTAPTIADFTAPTITDFTVPTITDFTAPTITDFTAPTITDFTAPTITDFTAPTITDFTAPTITDFTAPTITDFTAPTITDFTAPTITDFTAPTITDFTAPTITDFTAPTITDFTASTITDFTASTITDFTAPIITDFTAPTITDFTAPTITDFTAPTITDFTAPTITDFTPPNITDFTPNITDFTPPNITDFTPPTITDFTAPTITDFTPPTITDFTPPTITDFTPPNITDFTPPTITDFTPTITDFTPPTITDFTPPNITDFTPPTITEFTPPNITDFTPPTITEFTPPNITSTPPTATTTPPTTAVTCPSNTRTPPTTTTTTTKSTIGITSPPKSKCKLRYVNGCFHWTSPFFGKKTHYNFHECSVSGRSSTPHKVRFEAHQFQVSDHSHVSISLPYNRTITLSGNKPWSFTTPNCNFNMKFAAKGLNTGGGFNISVCPKKTPCHKIIKTSVSGTRGYEETPDFRSNKRHSELTQCEWWIEAPKGKRISVNIKTKMDESHDCTSNYACVNGRGDRKYPMETSSIYCGSGHQTVTSTDNMLCITYQGHKEQSSGMGFSYNVE